MRLARAFVVIFALVFAVSVLAVAAEKTAPAKRPEARQRAKQAPAPDQRPDWWGRNPEARKNVVQGKVQSVSATSIAVVEKDAVKNFVVNEQTRVVVRGEKATLADIAAGDTVAVRFAAGTNGLLTALGIMVPKPRVNGEITAIQGSTITLRAKDGTVSNVTVNERTRFISHGYRGTMADLRIGYKATVGGQQGEGGFIAQDVNFTPLLARGTVTAKNGSLVTIKTVRQGTLQLQATQATAVMVRPRVADNKKGTLDDVKVGTPVNAGYAASATGGNGTLLWIDVLTGQ